jgi:hypothetical protein
VLDLCDELVALKCKRQARFDFLRGDPGKNGYRAKLPVDGYYEALNLVVEYLETQHSSGISFFDKTDRMTVSGVHRGQQRRIYDQRRRETLKREAIVLVEIAHTDLIVGRLGKLARDRDRDKAIIRRALEAAGVRLKSDLDEGKCS